MLNPELLRILACPNCHAELEYKSGENKLICPSCRLKYLVEQGVPIMLADNAERF